MGHALSEDEVTEWLNNDQVMNICIMTKLFLMFSEVMTVDICEDDGDNEEEPDIVACPVTHAQAMGMFEKCITWL